MESVKLSQEIQDKANKIRLSLIYKTPSYEGGMMKVLKKEGMMENDKICKNCRFFEQPKDRGISKAGICKADTDSDKAIIPTERVMELESCGYFMEKEG